MKHAFLITSYNDIEILNLLINDISKIKNSMIFLSIDKNKLEFLKKIKSKFKNRKIYTHSANWASVKHYNAFIKILNIAIKKKCNYFHWIDGRTRIVVNATFFKEFFNKNKKFSFINYKKLPYKYWKYINANLNRIKYYHLVDYINLKKNKFAYLLNYFFILLQKIFFVNRVIFKQYFGGVGFCSLSSEAAKYLTLKYKTIKEKFNYTFTAEEIISQTILLNSNDQIKKYIINKTLIYQNWSKKYEEIPGILDSSDLKKIKNKKKIYIFARKFSSSVKQSVILGNNFA